MEIQECANRLREMSEKVRASWSYQECNEHRDELREIAYAIEEHVGTLRAEANST